VVAPITDEEEAMNVEVDVKVEVEVGKEETKGLIDGEVEALDVPLRPEEKRGLNWENGLYLAPLTTVGNLVCLFSPSQHHFALIVNIALPTPLHDIRSNNHDIRNGTSSTAYQWRK
jgi:hypothetical protein